MNKTIWKNLAAGALVAAFAISSANAQTTPANDTAAPAKAAVKAKAKTAAKPKAKKLPFVTVTVDNMRSVGLVELTATMSGGAGDPVKMAGPLAPGKKAVAHLAHEKDCMFDLHGVYEDGATTDDAGVELCKDKKVNLTD